MLVVWVAAGCSSPDGASTPDADRATPEVAVTLSPTPNRPAATGTSEAGPPSAIEVVALPGQTLAALAEPHLPAGRALIEFVAAIAVFNGIEDLDRLEAGQVVRIPTAPTAPPAAAEAATGTPAASPPTPQPTVAPPRATVESPLAPPAPVYFATLPPGATLPSGATCADWVRPAPESHPENRDANQRTGATGVRIDGATERFNEQYAGRIDGRYAGTTDEIIQWGACKWGFDEDLTRARAWVESSWRQSMTGDETGDGDQCRLAGLTPPCAQSYGLLQVKITVHEGTSPHALVSSAYNVDYALAWLRACFEGDFDWLGPAYGAGDLLGCTGAWFSGRWYDGGARRYLEDVQRALSDRSWETDSQQQ
ncbi:MAG: hypothetical protein GEU80_12940 [Dehalococcoidia bacterium]|nr:hypothetical protein [Dehalococcoidia bacterium]